MIEYSLSMDNIFVFVLIYGYFAVPAAYQHRVLFWSILGAPIMRGIMIGLGAALLERFGWISYLFGALLVFTGIRMAFQKEETPDPAANPLVKRFKRIVPVATRYEGGERVRPPRRETGRHAPLRRSADVGVAIVASSLRAPQRRT